MSAYSRLYTITFSGTAVNSTSPTGAIDAVYLSGVPVPSDDGVGLSVPSPAGAVSVPPPPEQPARRPLAPIAVPYVRYFRRVRS